MTTPSVSDIATALATAVATIPGVNTYEYLPDTFSPPAVVVGIDEVQYHGAFAGGDVTHTFTVYVIVARTSDRAGVLQMEGFMSQSGTNSPNSVSGAIEADPTLGGVVSSLIVEKSGPPASISIGSSGATYISLPFTVQVHA